MRLQIFAAGIVLAGAGLGTWLQMTARSEAATTPREHVIVHLKGASHNITVHSTPHGLRYSVERDGRLVADTVSIQTLRKLDLQAYQQINSGMADAAPNILAGSD